MTTKPSTVADVLSYMERSIARRQQRQRERDRFKAARNARYREALAVAGANEAVEDFLELCREMLKEVTGGE